MSEEPLEPRALARQLLVGLVLLVGIGLIAGLLLREPIERFSVVIVGWMGLPGIFVAILALDSLPFTWHDPLLLVGYEGGIDFWSLVGTAGFASCLSGFTGYLLGSALAPRPWVQRLFRKYRVFGFMQTYGAAFVVVAALTPFPFALATWAAGATRSPVRQVVLGSLFRFPRVLVYTALFVGGWKLTA